MFKIICGNCNNTMNLQPEKGEQPDVEKDAYYASSANETITLWQEHDVVGFSCDKCDNSIYTFV